MANFKYDGFIEAVLKGEVAWVSDNIRAVLVKSSYTPNKASHNWLSDIPSGDVLATSGNLTSRSATGGVARALDATFASVSGAVNSGRAIVLYKHTGTAGTSRLIAYIDTAPGLPVSPVGSDVRVVWPSTGIFSIG